MDDLTLEERALAWLADWHPSFSGKAIVNPDFTFRAVNPQFCKILEVTPAELIDKKFTDITPEPIRTLDVKNANLVKKDKIQSYLLQKTYEFSDGRRKDVTLLVKGVYHPDTRRFLFFVSSIMGKEEDELEVQSLSQMPTGLLPQVDKKKAIWTIITAVGLGLVYLFEKLLK